MKRAFQMTFLPGLIIILYSLTLCTGCSKKKEARYSGQQRLTAIKWYSKNVLLQTNTYTYSGDLVIAMAAINPNGLVIGADSIRYSGNNISEIRSYILYGGKLEMYDRFEVSGYCGDLPLKIIKYHYDNMFPVEEKSRIFYSYTGTQLTRADRYENEAGTWELIKSSSFKYDNTGRITERYDTNTYEDVKTTYSYDSHEMTGSLSLKYWYDGSITNYLTTNHEYRDGRIFRSTTNEWKSNQWKLSDIDQYDYSVSGYLTNINHVYTATDYTTYTDSRDEYSYCEGTGNYHQYANIIGENVTLPGDPIPYPLK